MLKQGTKLIFTRPRKHNNFICTNTSHVEGVHPARDEKIIRIHRPVGLHLAFCRPRGLQDEIIHDIRILHTGRSSTFSL